MSASVEVARSQLYLGSTTRLQKSAAGLHKGLRPNETIHHRTKAGKLILNRFHVATALPSQTGSHATKHTTRTTSNATQYKRTWPLATAKMATALTHPTTPSQHIVCSIFLQQKPSPFYNDAVIVCITNSDFLQITSMGLCLVHQSGQSALPCVMLLELGR
eukprot:4778982-Amphidinium_carterae.1